ncbi:MAG: hypothetical protein AB7I59_11455 [Geminicoccaceae bacterium]
MDQRGRLRINLSQREFEVEGSEEFVRSFAERIGELLDLFDVAPVPTTVPESESPPATVASPETLSTFGEFLLRLPSSATDVDKMLAAGYYVQLGSADDAFTTADANRRLTEQGIKLGNPSQCVKQSLLAKRVFLLNKGRYRVSQQGRAHLRQLLGPVVPD